MAIEIDKDAYMRYALQFTEKEKQLQNMFMDWLPDVIIDSHAHILPEPFAPELLDSFEYGSIMSTFPSFSLEESDQAKAVFYPNKKVISARFLIPFRGAILKETNECIGNLPDSEGIPVLYCLPDDTEYTIREMESRRYVALKAYFSYFDPPATKIYQYFVPEVLAVAEEMGLPIILHLPSSINSCKDDLKRVIQDFPKLKIVLAHMGLADKPSPEISAVFREFAMYPNICMDTSMVTSAGIIKSGLDAFGSERILFGSDEPLYLIRANEYTNPELGQRLITEYPYHWVDPIENRRYRYLAAGATHVLWQALSAIMDAVDPLSYVQRVSARNSIFFGNANRLFHR